MTWKNVISRLTITRRRRWLVTAIIYGLSLSVRFTSATGEEVEIPPQYVPRPHTLVSIMAKDSSRDSSRLPYQDWDFKSVQPIVFLQGRLPGAPPPGCFPP